METFYGVPVVLIIWWIYLASRSTNNSNAFVTEADTSYMQASSLNPDDQLAVFAKLAREGHASALASYTWQCLADGRHAEAIALYNETRMSLTSDAGNRLGWELANCDSNQALNLLATGSTIDDVRILWDRNVNMNHNECIFYSKLVGIREGKVPKSEIAKLSSALRKDIRSTLVSGASSKGWYKQWCDHALSEVSGVL